MPETETLGRVMRGAKVWWLILGAALLFAFFAAMFFARAPEVRVTPPPKGVAMLGRHVDDVVLQDVRGNTVTWGSLNGAPRAVFFGFTSCPEICPTTISDLASALERAGPRARAMRIDFITVDPERDTPAVLARYLDGFGPQFAGYAGAADQVLKLATAFRAGYRRTPTDGGGYTMDHTTTVYLLDASGEVKDTLAYQTPPDQLDAKLNAFLGR